MTLNQLLHAAQSVLFDSRPTLVTNSFFNNSQLKPRIQMLVNPATNHRSLWKYTLMLPVLGILVSLTAARERIAETLTSQPGQKITVSGRVVDEQKKPVQATIVIAGGTRGTETDADGRFKLVDVSTPTKLAISSVGFETKEIVVNDDKPVTITLIREQRGLKEVVVTGYRPKEESAQATNEVFTVVEQNPEFPGGEVALAEYLSRNLRYPAEAQQHNTSGKVFVQFVVSTDGFIQSPRIIKGIGNGCDEEAVRIVSQMPKWKPGQQNGRPVNVQFYLPIRFMLDGGPQPVAVEVTPAVSGAVSLTGTARRTEDFSAGKPLYIIDGVELNQDQPLNTLNPNNIENINVLKGESAQAAYGEKGKNGVIIITTRAKKP